MIHTDPRYPQGVRIMLGRAPGLSAPGPALGPLIPPSRSRMPGPLRRRIVIGWVRARANLTIAQIRAYIYSGTILDLATNRRILHT